MKNLAKQTIRYTFRTLLSTFRRNGFGKAVFDEEMLEILSNDQRYSNKQWQVTDKIFSICRRNLVNNEFWIPGVVRTVNVARKYFSYLSAHDYSKELPFLDLGCGVFNPFGVSSVFYLNGQKECWGLDQSGYDQNRAAEAILDLIMHAAIQPQDIQFSKIQDSQNIISRVEDFPIEAVRMGRFSKALMKMGLRNDVCDIREFNKKHPDILFGVVCSHTVLEHFLDTQECMRALKNLSAPEAIHYHYIDFVDHRGYTQPNKYDWWSFLEVDRAEQDTLCNKLRCSEFRNCLENAGFEIIKWEPETTELPAGLRRRLHSSWKDTSDEDLKTLRVSCVLRPR